MEKLISKSTLQRMPYYLQHIKKLHEEGKVEISAPYLAEFFGFTEIQVRKDLAAVSSIQGKPKIGFKIAPLIVDIENVLGYKNKNRAILVGVGSLGHALLCNSAFSDYGIEITAGFDANDDKIGIEIDEKPVLPMSQMKQYCMENDIKIGIITVPQIAAQRVCDQIVDSGIKAIWNFAQIHLSVPDGILVQNENMAASLALLFKHINNNS